MSNSFTTTEASGGDEDATSSIEDSLTLNAAGPKRVSGDQGSVEQHSLKDQIEADRYLASKAASQSANPIKFFKLIPPGQD